MDEQVQNTVKYQRHRFITYLPTNYLYTPSHYWLCKLPDGLWKIGFTKFATRMLGEMVDFSFDTKQGDKIEIGQILGWIEGFKAISDIYSVIAGSFHSVNPQLRTNITIINRDPYNSGFLYTATGEPDSKCMDVYNYQKHLDKIIEVLSAKMSDSEQNVP